MDNEIKDILKNIKTIAFYLANIKDAESNKGLRKDAQEKKIHLRNDIYDLKFSDFIYNINKLEELIYSKKDNEELNTELIEKVGIDNIPLKNDIHNIEPTGYELDVSKSEEPIDARKDNKQPNVKILKVCVASSNTLFEKREEIENFLTKKNNILIDNGIYLKFNVFENASNKFSSTRKQDDYNQELVYNSDIFICLIKDTVGKFTKEEFQKAYEKFKSGKKPRLMYVFFQKLTPKEKNAIISNPREFKGYNKVMALKKYIETINQVYREYDNKGNKLIELIDNNLQKDIDKILSE